MENGPRFISLPDGRRLAYAELGDPDGPTILYCHGFPSSRREARLLHEQAKARHARILAPDRPGYGDSEFLPERSIPGWADDVAALADRLDITRFAVLGVSGGGPYALACAWRLSERLTGCSLVCPLGPIYLAPVLAEMKWAPRLNFWMARVAPALTKLMLGRTTTGLLARWPAGVDHLRAISAPAPDRAELANLTVRRILTQTIQDAMLNHARGARQDLFLYTRHWEIPFPEITHPIQIWHGEADGTVPVSHSRWYAAHLPKASVFYRPGEGHYSLPLRYAGEILEKLSGES
jgi:pimeloyl-ACP methyl ester carboxylesterase